MSPNLGTGRLEQLAQSIAARVVSMILDTIDINGLLAKIDIDTLVSRIDLDAVVERLDLNALVERIDIEAVVDRVDIDELLRHVDINAIVKRVDIDEIVNELDIDALVGKTELGSIIAKSTTSILTEILDLIRSQGVGLDDFLARWTNRVLRRDPHAAALGPQSLVRGQVESTSSDDAGDDGDGGGAASSDPTVAVGPPPERTVARQGQYAGAVSRIAALAMDVAAAWALFAAGFGLVTYSVQVVSGHSISRDHPLVASVLFVVWIFAYFSYQWSTGGKTIGMAILGLQVVKADGSPAGGRASVLRTLTWPLGVLTLGIGFLGILTNRERRAVYDRIAGTAVVYAWDARAARLRWLARQTTAPAPVGEATVSG